MYINCHTGLENLSGLPAQVERAFLGISDEGTGCVVGGWGEVVDESWMAVSEPGGHGDRSSWWGAVAASSCLGVKAYAGPPSAFWNLFSLLSPKARQPGTSLETGTCKNPMVRSVRSAHHPGLSGPVHLSRCSSPWSLKPHPPPGATTPWATLLSNLASLGGSTAPLASTHFAFNLAPSVRGSNSSYHTTP